VEQIGKAALSQDKPGFARQLVGIAQTAQVVDARVAILEGRILARERKYPSAIAAFERARDLSVRNPWPFFYLGRMYLRVGELEKASEVLEAGQEFYYDNQCHNPRAISLIQALLVQSYVLQDEVSAAKPLLEILRQRDPDNPEVVLADAMIRLKEQGIRQAHDAYRELKAAKIQSRDDRCQFHLYYGKFLCGIEAFLDACNEFRAAHRADQTNIYVLIQWARTLFQMAEKATVESTWRGESDGGKALAMECAEVVRKIHGIDKSNDVARSLQEDLHIRFHVDL
jgi:predicted Zn-dependent protease